MNMKLIKKSTIIFFSVLLLMGLATHKTNASEMSSYITINNINDYEVLPSYELSYPNGKVVFVDSLDEAQKLLSEWELLDSGETDENGVIVIQGWFPEGEIKIVEKEAPDGYVIEKPKIVNLFEKETTFVNKKEEPKPNIEEPKPEPQLEPKKEEPRPVVIPKTGISSFVEKILNVSKLVRESEVFKQQQEQQIQTEFTIHKVNEEDEPLKGAKFEIYGKPLIRVKVYFNKVYSSYVARDNDIDDENGDETNRYVLDRFYKTEIKINIIEDHEEGNEFYFSTTTSFTPEKSVFSKFLHPGVYTICEETYLDGTTAYRNSNGQQSYLKSYKLKINDDGTIESVGNVEWQWLQRVDTSDFYTEKYIIDSNPIDYPFVNYDPKEYIDVDLDGVVVSITNFSEKHIKWK